MGPSDTDPGPKGPRRTSGRPSKWPGQALDRRPDVPPETLIMSFRFRKMHGLGNDFVVIDAREQPVRLDADRVRAIADRRTGIGCDQLILLEPSADADLRMRVWNSDGGEVEACGNAARCIVLSEGGEIRIETAGGIIAGKADGSGARVDMGEPRFGWEEIPLAYAMDTEQLPVGWEALESPAAINVGNPHLVFIVEDAEAVDLGRLGPIIENDPLFPDRINVNVAEITGGGLKVRTWERGAGLTAACGTGACASAVAAIRRRLVLSPVEVDLPGGRLTIEWGPSENVRMAGPAVVAFSGEYPG